MVEPPAEDDFELADLAGELEGPFEDEFTLDDLDAAAYGPDDEFPPFPEEELASLKRRRSGRVFAVVAGMLAIVAIGGAAVFLYRSDAGTGSPPPIIAANSGPTKVPPDEPAAAETDPQGKLIYDRVDEFGRRLRDPAGDVRRSGDRRYSCARRRCRRQSHHARDHSRRSGDRLRRYPETAPETP